MNKNSAGKILRLILLLTALSPCCQLKAHQVCWSGNAMGFLTNNPLNIYTLISTNGEVEVDPTWSEPCTVTVYLYPINNDLISAQVLNPNPSKKVKIQVNVLRSPSNHVELVYLKGYWSATGLPLFNGCDATGTNDFTVPITVSDEVPRFTIFYSAKTEMVDLDTKYIAALGVSSCLTGPFEIKAIGQQYSLSARGDGEYYKRITDLGGLVSGVVQDNAGSPISGIQFTYPYGGLSGVSDAGGNYYLDRFNAGYQFVNIIHPNGVVLPVEFPSYDDSIINYKVSMAKPSAATNPCGYIPWCAIGYGIQDGTPTSLFYAGGANAPSNNLVQVMVTPPTGPAYSIHPGMNRLQYTRTNPASGDWYISATACTQTETAHITVP